jgi:hypothetical protein
MYGIYVNNGYTRPKSKKAVKDILADGGKVYLEGTSVFGNEYSGLVDDAPNGTYTFVGPDPYNSRKFYGTMVVSNGKAMVR